MRCAGGIKRDAVLVSDEQDLHPAQRLRGLSGTRLQGTCHTQQLNHDIRRTL